MNSRPLWPPFAPLMVDQMRSGHGEVVDHLLFDLGVEVAASYCCEHVFEPGVFFAAGDDEWGVAHA